MKQLNSIKDDILLNKTTKHFSPLITLNCKARADNKGNEFHQTEPLQKEAKHKATL